jgi:hypothetical protein
MANQMMSTNGNATIVTNTTSVSQMVIPSTATSKEIPTLYPTSTKQMTNTPDRRVLTAAAVLTQAAILPSSTPALSCTGLSIDKERRSGGEALIICAEGEKYVIENLSDGVYQIGPNQKFFVYITNDGLVFAARVHDKQLIQIGEVKALTMIRVDDVPKFIIKFLGNHPYQLYVEEYWEHQNRTIPIPRYITTPN